MGVARKVVLVTDKDFELSEIRPLLDLVARRIARELVNRAADAEETSCQEETRSNKHPDRLNPDAFEQK